jgi:hypothetical protein
VERPYGDFIRSLTLVKGVDAGKITADYHDGVPRSPRAEAGRAQAEEDRERARR